MLKTELLQKLSEVKTRSAWDKGVNTYAQEMVERMEDVDEFDYSTVREVLLNGAEDELQYSQGGCSLIYNSDIAKRLCTASELKRTKYGQLDPNKNEDWLRCQARAIYQAILSIKWIIEDNQ